MLCMCCIIDHNLTTSPTAEQGTLLYVMLVPVVKADHLDLQYGSIFGAHQNRWAGCVPCSRSHPSNSPKAQESSSGDCCRQNQF